jgi:hypothetical protein
MVERLLQTKATRFTLLNLGTAILVVTWLAVACYAITYLVSHQGDP